MKKVTVTAACEQEKLRAIQFYLAKGNTSLEAELDRFLERLYKKYVPAQTREYIDSMEATEERPRAKPERPAPPVSEKGEAT